MFQAWLLAWLSACSLCGWGPASRFPSCPLLPELGSQPTNPSEPCVWSPLTAYTHFTPSLLITLPSATCSYTALSLNLPSSFQCQLYLPGCWPVILQHSSATSTSVWPASLDFLKFLELCRSILCCLWWAPPLLTIVETTVNDIQTHRD